MKKIRAWAVVLPDGEMIGRIDGSLDVYHDRRAAIEFRNRIYPTQVRVIRVEITPLAKPKKKK